VALAEGCETTGMPIALDEIAGALFEVARSRQARLWLGQLNAVFASVGTKTESVNETLNAPFRGEASSFDVFEEDDALAPFFNAASADLRDARQETRQRVNRLFYCMLLLGIISASTVITGAGLAIAGATAIATLTGAGGVLAGITGAYFGLMYRTETAELRQLIHDLRCFEQVRLGVWLARQIESPKERNVAVRDLILLIKEAGEKGSRDA
jgi:NAD(P)H-hydrate repair Nnr-like enzyme with NAD(P)H-hydrate dehydratase domain